MSFDTVNHILWPHDQELTEREICDCCKERVDDPIEIDGRLFCDHCASDYAWLRNEGFIRTAHERTRRLVSSESWSDYCLNILMALK